MPLDMSYESDSSEEGSPKVQRKGNNKAPSLNDTEAFPETFGAGAPAPAVPSGINFASLAGKFVPEESSNEFDLSQPRPMQRKTVTRIARLREMYYKSRDVCNKPLGTVWSLYVDSGIQGPEKAVECESKLMGNVGTTKAFDPLIAPLRHAVLSPGSNVRLFKSNGLTSPSALDETLEKGGKWALPVSKELSADVFEELCLYVLDERLGWAADGCVLAVRDGKDILQVWSKSAPNADVVAKMSSDINNILGLEENFPVSFSLHSETFKKASKARTYFCVEPVSGGAYVQSQGTALQPRSKTEVIRDKKDKKKNKGKKGDEGFITEGAPRVQNKTSKSPTSTTTTESKTASTENMFGNLEVHEESGSKKKGSKEEQDVPLVFTRRKKPPSKKGSSKKSKKDEFADLPVQPGAVVPLPLFMGAGSVIFLVLAILLWSYTQSS